MRTDKPRRRPTPASVAAAADAGDRPLSGRYVAAGGAAVTGARLVLHVDIDGPQALWVISGEIRRSRGRAAAGHFIGRVKRHTSTATGIRLLVSDCSMRWPGRDVGRVRLEVGLHRPAPDDGRPWATARFVGRAAWMGSFRLVRESPWFRRVEIQVDRERGARPVEPYLTHTHPDRPADLPNRSLTLERVFADAGIGLVRSPHGHVISASEAGEDRKWSSEELHDAMTVHWQAFARQPQWKMWILLARQSDRARLGGIMFNANIPEPGGVNRQGVALFTRCEYFFSPRGGFCTHNLPPREAARRELFFTLAHEVGHVFNLTHPDERVRGHCWHAPLWARVGRREHALTFMNLPNRPTPFSGANASWFYRRFHFRFERSELLFMRHAAEQYVEMGGPAWVSSHARQALTVDPRLELRVRSRKRHYELGEPVRLELRLRNVHTRPITAHANLDPSDGFVELLVTGPGGSRRPFLPLEHTYQALGQQRLAPGEALAHDVDLTVGSLGFPFKQPGTYRVEAWYANLDGRGARAVLDIRVRPPTGLQSPTVREMFDARIGRVLRFGGTRVLHEVNDRLDWIRSRLGPEHPVSVHLAAARFLALARGGRVFDLERGRTRMVPPEPDRALDLVTGLVTDRADTTADTLGDVQFRRVLDAYIAAALQAGRHALAREAQRWCPLAVRHRPG